MSVTLKDLAGLAGVTVGTVSRALRGDPRVAAKTGDRIRRLAKSRSYVPNIAASELVTGSTRLVGLILSALSTSLYKQITEATLETLVREDLDAVLALTHDEAGLEEKAIERLLRRRVQGFIVQPGLRAPRAAVYERLARAGLPVVFFDRVCPQVPHATTVVVDNRGGGRLAAKRFLATGRRRLAVFHDRVRGALGVVEDRAQGFLEAAGARGEAIGHKHMDRLLSGTFDAVFATSDQSALRVLQAAATRGLRVPDDIAVIGFDDLDFAPLLSVPLTTIRQPQREMGEAAGRALLDLRAGKRVPRRIELPVSLVVRASG